MFFLGDNHLDITRYLKPGEKKCHGNDRQCLTVTEEDTVYNIKLRADAEDDMALLSSQFSTLSSGSTPSQSTSQRLTEVNLEQAESPLYPYLGPVGESSIMDDEDSLDGGWGDGGRDRPGLRGDGDRGLGRVCASGSGGAVGPGGVGVDVTVGGGAAALGGGVGAQGGGGVGG